MAQRKPKRLSTHRDLSSRQWAWEFLRFNAEYRSAYAEWKHLPDAVRNFSSVGDIPLCNCEPDTPMSYFDVVPAALDNETVGEWLSRTSDERKNGWRLRPSSRLKPPKEFLISEWVDPSLSPLPKEKEYIWDQFNVASIVGLFFERNKPFFAENSNLSLTNIHELAFVFDVRSPMAFLEKQFKNAVHAHRAKLREFGLGEPPILYSGKTIINSTGVYEDYVQILKRLDDGETEEEIKHTERRNSPRVNESSTYPDKVRKQIPQAIELRDGGYKRIVYKDDFVGELKPKS